MGNGMRQNVLALIVGGAVRLLTSIPLNIAWYLACIAVFPETFNAPTETFPWWFFAGVLFISAVSGTASGMVTVALAQKPARRFVLLMTIVMVVRRLGGYSGNGNMLASVRMMRSFASMSYAAQCRYKREEDGHSLCYEPSTTGMSHQSLHRHLGPEREQ